MKESSTELLEERKKRILDAVALKIPDRIPLFIPFNMFAASYSELSYQDALENPDKWMQAILKVHQDFEPDMCSARAFDAGSNRTLQTRLYRWPGYGTGPESPPQYCEAEYMKAEEYDRFLSDPSDYIMRTHVPRVYGAMEGFKYLPSLSSLVYFYEDFAAMFSSDATIKSLKELTLAAEQAAEFASKRNILSQQLLNSGFPELEGGIVFCPFDVISDYLRGLRGSSLDTYRHPDKLLEAQKKLLPVILEGAVTGAAISGRSFIVLPLHRGSDEFMSAKQFEKFYWPYLKELITGLIDSNLTPMVIFEGNYTSRLEYLNELPAGKIFGWFDRTDLFKAKEIIGDTICLVGGMPITMLRAGTPGQVREHTRNIIETLGKGGGYIMTSSTVIDVARPELVRAWVDATREFGIYK